MSDNESFESQTDTEGSTDSEDIAEQSSVQPYQIEPVADSDYEKQTKTAFFVKLLRRDSKQDVSKYAEHITDEFVGVKFGRCFRTTAVFVQLRSLGPLQSQNFPILALFVLDVMLVEFGMHNNSD